MRSAPLVLSKIVPPRPGSGVIVRQRLMARLLAAGDSKLVLVTGGAGFGKTTLLIQWHQHLENAGAKVVWLSLAPGDGSLPRFCAILAGALRHGGVPIDPDALIPPEEGAGCEQAVDVLLDALARAPGNLHLLLDDFHHVHDPATVRLVQAMADAILPRLHLVIASRTLPALRLGRLRAMEELTAIGCAELPFDLGETSAFLKARSGGRFGIETARQIHDITDGWPVGVRLASRALSDLSCSDGKTVRTRLCDSGSLDDYLSEEVVGELPVALLDFILQVSALRCFDAELAAWITGRGDAADLIAQILAGHMFLLPLERRDGPSWYRFHPMFDAYLDKRREQSGMDVAALHRRAAHWLLQRGRFADAMRSAALSDDLDMVAQLVGRAFPARDSLAGLGVLARWLEGLGCERLAGYPGLLRIGAWAYVLTGRQDLSERWLSRLESASTEPADARHVWLLKALIATQRDDGATALAALDALQTIGPAPVPDADEHLEIALRMHWLAAQGHHPQARGLYNSAAARRTRTGRGELALVAAAVAAGVAMREGNAVEAERIGVAALRRARTIHGGRSLCAAVCATVTAQAWYELDRIDEAHEALLYCRTALRTASPALKLHAALTFGRIKALREGPQEALTYLASAELHFRSLGVDRGVVHMVAEQQRIALACGDWRHAQTLQGVLDDLAARQSGTASHVAEIGAMVAISRARLALVQGLAHAAMDAIEAARRFAGILGCGRLLVASDLLQARALRALGQHTQAQACAQAALAACYRMGLYRTLIDEGADLRELLRSAAAPAAVPLAAYVAKLFGEPVASANPELPQAPAPAEARADEASLALTHREQEVLALLEQSMSNKRIAMALNISVQTVKWNLKKIFVKLNVTSRYDAIIAARKHGLCRH